jgi:PilZ domain-containing protein
MQLHSGATPMAEAAFAIKRGNPRYSFSAEAEAILRDGTSIPAQVFELSSHGCYIDALQPLSVGSELHLCISNGPSTCELPAKVIYLHSGYGFALYGMGIAFGEMTAEQHSEIGAWLRELATNQSPKNPN